MRNRYTNALQVTVLITGVIYLFVGILFYFAPLAVLKIFAELVSENWIDMVRDNELVAPLYHITRGLSALLFTSGLAMMLPLFDPLRYRGLIYCNGVIFPFFAIVLGLFETGFLTSSSENSSLAIVEYLFIVLLLVFIINLAGLIITMKQAKAGVE